MTTSKSVNNRTGEGVMMSNRFAAGLVKVREVGGKAGPATPDVTTDSQQTTTIAPSRIGKVAVSAYFDPAVRQQLRSWRSRKTARRPRSWPTRSTCCSRSTASRRLPAPDRRSCGHAAMRSFTHVNMVACRHATMGIREHVRDAHEWMIVLRCISKGKPAHRFDMEQHCCAECSRQAPIDNESAQNENPRR